MTLMLPKMVQNPSNKIEYRFFHYKYKAINLRLSSLSSDETLFQSVSPIYQEALEKSGYKIRLQFKPQQTTNTTQKRCRKR